MDSEQTPAAVIVGASAGVGRAIAAALAERGWRLLLVASDRAELEALQADLRIRFGSDAAIDAVDLAAAGFDGEACVARWEQILPRARAALFPAGYSEDADVVGQSSRAMERLIAINFGSIAKLLGAYAARRLADGASTTLVVFSSIAAAVPRRRNLTYAAAKNALESYAWSIRHALTGTATRIQIYRLGYIDTSLSFGQQLRLPIASPQETAEHVVRRLDTNVPLAYYPRFWRIVVGILTSLPRAVFERLRF